MSHQHCPALNLGQRQVSFLELTVGKELFYYVWLLIVYLIIIIILNIKENVDLIFLLSSAL